MMPDDIPNVPMTPREYVELIALPTLHEFLCARDDRRRAYLACLVVCHVADSIGLAEVGLEPGFATLSTTARKRKTDTATKSAQSVVLERCGPIFTLVQDMANGTKHPARLPLLPGREVRVPPFSFGVAGPGFGLGRIGTPGLAVRINDRQALLDACVQQVLAAFMCAYSAHLGGIALAFMDSGLPVPGLDMRPEWLANISAWAGGQIEFAEVWLFGSRANGSSLPDRDVELGVVLAARSAGEQGAPCRDWAHESWLTSRDMWLGQLQLGVGGRLRLEVFSRPGEPRGAEEAAARASAILLWTRAYMTDAKLASLSTPDPCRHDQRRL